MKIVFQDLSGKEPKWGTINPVASGNKTWGFPSPYEESDWSSWIDNNPHVFSDSNKKLVCEKHEWVNAGVQKTWCKKCDKSGRWVMGNVEIDP